MLEMKGNGVSVLRRNLAFLLELEGHFYLLALFCEYFLTT